MLECVIFSRKLVSTFLCIIYNVSMLEEPYLSLLLWRFKFDVIGCSFVDIKSECV